jgi:predicted secreted protein
MSLTLGLALYFLIWWVVLFAVLPLGVRTQGEEGNIVPGTPESAPAKPRLVRVAIITSLVAGIVFAGLWVVVTRNLLGL